MNSGNLKKRLLATVLAAAGTCTAGALVGTSAFADDLGHVG